MKTGAHKPSKVAAVNPSLFYSYVLLLPPDYNGERECVPYHGDFTVGWFLTANILEWRILWNVGMIYIVRGDEQLQIANIHVLVTR